VVIVAAAAAACVAPKVLEGAHVVVAAAVGLRSAGAGTDREAGRGREEGEGREGRGRWRSAPHPKGEKFKKNLNFFDFPRNFVFKNLKQKKPNSRFYSPQNRPLQREDKTYKMSGLNSDGEERPFTIVLGGPLQNMAPMVAVHQLPCKIEHDGPARVDVFFKVTEEHGKPLEAGFRGRRLLGAKAKIPDGATGLVLNQAWNEEDDSPGMHIVGKFNEIHHWQHDAVPSNADSSVHKWMEWLLLARSIHGPTVVD